MKKLKKIAVVSALFCLPLFFLTGCSKVSLTGTDTGAPADGQARPQDGGTPPEGSMPPEGGTPPAGAPQGDL
jgi:hypothetical protein